MHVGMGLLGLSRHRLMLACAFWVCLLECVPCGSTCCVDSSNGLLKKMEKHGIFMILCWVVWSGWVNMTWSCLV